MTARRTSPILAAVLRNLSRATERESILPALRLLVNIGGGLPRTSSLLSRRATSSPVSRTTATTARLDSRLMQLSDESVSFLLSGLKSAPSRPLDESPQPSKKSSPHVARRS